MGPAFVHDQVQAVVCGDCSVIGESFRQKFIQRPVANERGGQSCGIAAGQPVPDSSHDVIRPQIIAKIASDSIGIKGSIGRARAFCLGQRGVQQRHFQPHPAGVGRYDPHQTVGIGGIDPRPDIRHLRRPQPCKLHPGIIPGSIAPTGAGLILRPDRLGKDEIPQLVGIFDIGFQPGVEHVVDQRGKGRNKGVVGPMRDVEPRIGADLVGQLDHHFDRNATPAKGIVGLQGPVRPQHLRRAVGVHPIHESHRPQIADMAQPCGVEHCACLKLVDQLLFDHCDIADRVGGVGRTDADANQAFAGGVTEPQRAGPGVDIAGQTAQGDLTLPIIGQPIAPGQ